MEKCCTLNWFTCWHDAGTSAHAIVIYIGSAVVTQWPVQNYAPTIETICYICNML